MKCPHGCPWEHQPEHWHYKNLTMTTKQFRSWLKVRLDNLSGRTKRISTRKMGGKKFYAVGDDELIADLNDTLIAAKQRRKLVK